MTPSDVDPLALYRPRDPRASDLWRLTDQHFETFQQVYDERFQAKYGYWRPFIGRSAAAFLKCRCYYSNKSRGLRKKAAAEQAEPSAKPSDPDDASGAAPTRCSKTWAMLIKRVYEVEPLSCPRCGTEMQVVAFIHPPQGEVIEKILRHCGLWRGSAPRPPPDVEDLVHDLDGCFSVSPTGSSDQAGELTFVDMDTFEATF